MATFYNEETKTDENCELNCDKCSYIDYSTYKIVKTNDALESGWSDAKWKNVINPHS